MSGLRSLSSSESQRPNWDPQEFICFGDLGIFRKDYVKRALEDEIGGALPPLDQEVIESPQQHEVLTENIEQAIRAQADLWGTFVG